MNSKKKYVYILDDETTVINTNQTTAESMQEEVKYAIPKPHNEIGMTYVTMKDFIFDPEQQPAQVV